MIMQAYKAYYERGRFIPFVEIEIPEGSQAIVTVLDETPDDLSRRQSDAMTRFREEIRGCDEPVPEFERIKLREVEL